MTPLPDCTLSALRIGQIPPSLRNALLRAAAQACALHLLAGGRLSDLREDLCRFHNGRFFPAPPPPSPPPPLDRSQLESDLRRLASSFEFLAPSPANQLRFLLRLARLIGHPLWARVFLDRLHRETAHRHRLAAKALLRDADPLDLPDHVGVLPPGWTAHSVLLALHSPSARLLHRSRRASVWRCSLNGHDLIVKHYSPNPSPWKRRLEPSRARRAWAGSHLLLRAGIRCPRPLGWFEHRPNGTTTDAWFLSLPAPPGDNLRLWLRRHQRDLSPADRSLLRHRLRSEFRRLHTAGLLHLDSKLGNLQLDPHGRFCWLDLEDIRARPPSTFSFLRTCYQLNGSLPRRFPPHERTAFTSGFTRHIPLASHPLFLHYVHWQTRRRLLRERKGICHA